MLYRGTLSHLEATPAEPAPPQGMYWTSYRQAYRPGRQQHEHVESEPWRRRWRRTADLTPLSEETGSGDAPGLGTGPGHQQRPSSAVMNNPVYTRHRDGVADSTGLSHKEREERVRQFKQLQAEEAQRKKDELARQEEQAARQREHAEQERRRRVEELRSRENERRSQVEDRRRQMEELEAERRTAILRRNQEREAMLETRRKHQSSQIVFGFGSSTPRWESPSDMGKRSTSTTQLLDPAGPGGDGRPTLDGKRPTSAAPGHASAAARAAPATAASARLRGEEEPSARRYRSDLTPTTPGASFRDPPRPAARHRSPGISGAATPTSPSRPTSALSQQSGAPGGVVHLRSRVSPRRQRPVSIAGLPSRTAPSPATAENNNVKQEREVKTPVRATTPRRPQSASTPSSETPRRAQPASTPSSETPRRPVSATRRTPAQVKADDAKKKEKKQQRSKSNTPQPSPVVEVAPAEQQQPAAPAEQQQEPTAPAEEQQEPAAQQQESIAPEQQLEPEAPAEQQREPSVAAEQQEPAAAPVEQQQQQQQQQPEPAGLQQETPAADQPAEVQPPVELAVEAVEEPTVAPPAADTSASAAAAEERADSPAREVPELLVQPATPQQQRESSPSPAADTQDAGTPGEKRRAGYTSENEAKAALAEKRRRAREEAERQAELERQRLEQLQREEEERVRREEEQRRRDEEEMVRLMEEAKQAEELRLQKAIEEAERARAEEEQRRQEEERQRQQREEEEARAREEAEKARKEAEEKLRREEAERQKRRSRVAEIMSRTRGANNLQNKSDDPEAQEEGSASPSVSEMNAANAQQDQQPPAGSQLDASRPDLIPRQPVDTVHEPMSTDSSPVHTNGSTNGHTAGSAAGTASTADSGSPESPAGSGLSTGPPPPAATTPTRSDSGLPSGDYGSSLSSLDPLSLKSTTTVSNEDSLNSNVSETTATPEPADSSTTVPVELHSQQPISPPQITDLLQL